MDDSSSSDTAAAGSFGGWCAGTATTAAVTHTAATTNRLPVTSHTQASLQPSSPLFVEHEDESSAGSGHPEDAEHAAFDRMFVPLKSLELEELVKSTSPDSSSTPKLLRAMRDEQDQRPAGLKRNTMPAAQMKWIGAVLWWGWWWLWGRFVVETRPPSSFLMSLMPPPPSSLLPPPSSSFFLLLLLLLLLRPQHAQTRAPILPL
jgi:hypothetical protein